MNLSSMFHVWTFPLWFVSVDMQVFTVTPVSWSREEVAPNKQHLQRDRKKGPVGFQVDHSNESKLKVLLCADDTELFLSRHLDGQKLKPFKGMPYNICSERKWQLHDVHLLSNNPQFSRAGTMSPLHPGFWDPCLFLWWGNRVSKTKSEVKSLKCD